MGTWIACGVRWKGRCRWRFIMSWCGGVIVAVSHFRGIPGPSWRHRRGRSLRRKLPVLCRPPDSPLPAASASAPRWKMHPQNKGETGAIQRIGMQRDIAMESTARGHTERGERGRLSAGRRGRERESEREGDCPRGAIHRVSSRWMANGLENGHKKTGEKKGGRYKYKTQMTSTYHIAVIRCVRK